MARGSNTTINELMGKKGADFDKEGVSLHDLPGLLGEGMPKLEFHALGRVRLMRALQQRFGDGYRNIPGIQQVISEFDKNAKIELEHHILKKKWGRK